MAASSSLYQRLVKIAGEYIGEDKAVGAISRQLKHCNATPEAFDAAQLKKILSKVITATSLYIADAGAKTALESKLKALI